MKLKELKLQIKVAESFLTDEPETEYATRLQHYFDALPRVKFRDLPKKLQDHIRATITPESLQAFLVDCYGEEAYKTMLADYLNSTCKPKPEETEEELESRKEELTERLLTATRNSATYTVQRVTYPSQIDGSEGDLQPRADLYGTHACEAFERQITKATGKTGKRSSGSKAVSIVSAGSRQILISDKRYKNALTPQTNRTAYIAKAKPTFFESAEYTDGVLNIEKLKNGVYSFNYEQDKDLDLPLLNQIYTAAIKAGTDAGGGTITVSIPKFFREMGIDTSGNAAQDVMSKISEFDDYIGVMEDTGRLGKLLTLLSYDAQNKTMQLAMPYMFMVMEAVAEHNKVSGKTKKGDLYEYTMPGYNRLCHSSIVKERNKPAIYLVYEVTTRLLQRGSRPDTKTYRGKGAKAKKNSSEVTYSVSYKELVDAIPQLRCKLDAYRTTSDKNKALKRAFTGFYRLLKNKTDAYQFFADLKVSEIVPTMSTLEEQLTITHEGKNPDYTPPA